MNESFIRPAAGELLLLVALLFVPACTPTAEDEADASPVSGSVARALVVDGRRGPDEQCDDGNGTGGDGCSAAFVIEAGYLCHVPGRACSLASLCGNNVINPGEGCDDGDTTQGTNGCSSTCGLALCGNGVLDNRQFPSFAQEMCDDGNTVDGDGCSATCNVELGFGCLGAPSRCVASGVAFFNTGVDAAGRRLESGADPHWVNTATGNPAATTARGALDWPQETMTARFMESPVDQEVCLSQTFLIPSTVNAAQLRMRIATFNDNFFSALRVNGAERTPLVVSEPPGQPWQKNIVRQLGPGWFTPGVNTITICNDSFGGLPNAMRYLFVDATDDSCGNGSVSARERCDDGGTASGDGCSNSCEVEPTYACAGEPSDCAAVCGNGVLNAGEECDDGGNSGGDGCSALCRVEPTYSCPVVGEPCVVTCGDGSVDAGEACDDGNLYANDGCSLACRVERDFTCSGEPSVCVARCGNGARDPGELCDDGNRVPGDGCSAACTLEMGYACTGTVCAVTCGNGNVDAGEECDDGNLVTGDGCSAECAVQAGYACSRPAAGPSVCAPSCGNGGVNSNEFCDDGNVTSGDGCSSSCRVEFGYSCSGAPSTCSTLCGDGFRAGTEECDDANPQHVAGCVGCVAQPGYICGVSCLNTCGNGALDLGEQCDDGDRTAGDGCSARCVTEAGFVCVGLPSVCSVRCGDGIAHASEACDDGNFDDADACTTTCRRTIGQACTVDAECEVKCAVTDQTCTDDVTPPGEATITAPVDQATIVGTVQVMGSAEPNAFVDLFVDGGSSPVTRVTVDGSGMFTAELTLGLGTRSLAARAVDRAGNVGDHSSVVSFEVVECLDDDDCQVGVTECATDTHTCEPLVVIPMDGGVVLDADVETDAGDDASTNVDAHVGRDASVDAGTPTVSGGGCSCDLAGAAPPSQSSLWWLAMFFVVGAVVVRRR